MPFALLLLLAASVAILPAQGQRGALAYEVVVESPSTIEDTLRKLSRDGWACAAVARPTGMALSTNMAVVMNRIGPGGAPAPALRVLSATPGALEEIETPLNAAAAEGFGLCGLTLTKPLRGQSIALAVTAVLSRTSTTPTGLTYRLVRSRGRREDWALLERAAAEGFVVSRLVSRPDPGAVNTSDIVFVAEKADASRPMRYELAFAGNGVALQKEIDKSTAKGHCVQAAWATAERVSVLLAKPVDGACDAKHEYEVEESSRFTIDSADGDLLALFRMKDETIALYDGRQRATEYSLIAGVLPDPILPAVRSVFPPREHQLLIDQLDADLRRGFRPIDLTWRDSGTGMRAVDIILSRPRQ